MSDAEGRRDDVSHPPILEREGDMLTGHQGSERGSPEEVFARNKRKYLRGKITRAINRLKQSMEAADVDTRRVTLVLNEIKSDYTVACEFNGQLYDFVTPDDTTRLDQWEADLVNDVYDIQETIEDYLKTLTIEDTVPLSVSVTNRSVTDSPAAVENIQLNSNAQILDNQSLPGTVPVNVSKTLNVNATSFIPLVNQPVLKTVDSWIDCLNEYQETTLPQVNTDINITEALFKLEASRDIPTIRLDKFNGNPLKYVDFVERFKIYIHDKPHLSDDLRMVQLTMHLEGDAERAISGLGASGIMYATALKCLKEQFGHPSIIARACLRKLTFGATLGANDREGLRNFSLDMINCMSVICRIGYEADMNASESLRQIVRRLPGHMIGKWKMRAAELREKGQIPTIKEVSELIKRQVRADYDPDFGDLESRKGSTTGKVSSNYNKAGLYSEQGHTQKVVKCYQCSEAHRLTECPTFKDMKVKDRLEQVKKLRLCFSCLNRGHGFSECRLKKTCSYDGCSRSHHVLLHLDPPSTSGVSSVLDRNGILPVVRVTFRAPNGKEREGNVLIDSGAGTTVIRREFAKALGLQGKKERLDVSVVGGDTVAQPNSRRVSFCVSALSGRQMYNIEAHEIEKTVLSVPPLDRKWIKSFNHLSDLELSHRAGPIDLILGVQYSHLHVESEIRKGLPFEPVGKCTPLGWYVMGSDSVKRASSVCCIAIVQNVDLDNFYAMETLGIQGVDCTCPNQAMSFENRQVLKSFSETCVKEGDRYKIGLPWKQDPTCLPNNYGLAEKRLLSLEKGLLKDSRKAKLYCEVMDQYINNGWAIQLTSQEIEEIKPAYYLPHHGVYRPEKESTPLRVVFDPASEFKGVSLNSILCKGPCLIGNLLGVLIRFREEEIAFMGDISKMYLQVCLYDRDTYAHRFLWRNLDNSREPSVYRLLRIPFGDKPSPDMASYVILRIAEETKAQYPDAAIILERDRYMDDLLHSCATHEEAVSKMNQLDTVLNTGCFRIKQWFCSSNREDEIEYGSSRNSCEMDKCVNEVRQDSNLESVPLDKDDESTKALGIVWNVKGDLLKCNVKKIETEKLTKRIILSRISGIYDPLGLVSVVIIKAKIALQDIWRSKEYGWDDELPSSVQSLWFEIFEQIEQLAKVDFPRTLKPYGVTGDSQLHVFSDASSSVYGAVAYILWPTVEGPKVRLVLGKARVAPLRQTTIPRLELMGALIACRLTKTLMDEFKVKPGRVVCWTDSQIVLHWINSDSGTLKTFVGVRVSEIQSTFGPNLWRFVPTKLNPADDLTRGLTADKLEGRWKHGPEFLQLAETEWPISDVFQQAEDIEKKHLKPVCVISPVVPILNACNYSSWTRLVRVTAYIQRFCHNIQVRANQTGEKYIGSLQPEELGKAENYWVNTTQQEITDWDKRYQELSPFMEKGIIRVGGRLRKTALIYDQIHPVILPASHHISKLIMREIHAKYGHVGAERTLSESRRQYWIVKGRNMARRLVKDCIVCRKLRQNPHTTLMADLPPERMRPHTPPFDVTGVDLFGPFNLKYGRNKTQKAWGAIFTCATVRAIHLEVVDSLSTDAFMFALRRFAAHHGWPSTIISDNGSSFVGANKELKKLVKEGKKQIEDFASLHRVKWKFITPLSPHQGGLYESLIKQVKGCIKVSIGQQLLSWNEMSTVFSEVECLVNSRPLGYAANSPDDHQPLTPNHFLLGRASPDVPQGQFNETRNLNKRFEYIQALINHCWERFVREYVPTLHKRNKWQTKGIQLKCGDIVLLTDMNAPRGKWNLGRVLEVYPGTDGIVRNVKVRTQHGEYRRSVQKCCVILND